MPSDNLNVCILAIESSCDETSAAVIKNGTMLSNIVASQLIHENYGGVVPELASRAHQQDIVRVVKEAMEEAQISNSELSAIAFTRGPGLLGSLLVGVSFAKSLALGLGIPIIEVNHMQAHILAHFIRDPTPRFPFLSLTVSGGHTQIVRIDDHLQMTLIGETLDDAVGEAFDKAAKMLGLGYPGGPKIDKLASEGNREAFSFPISEIPGLNFSFSGIKTSLLYFIQKQGMDFTEKNMADICASYQYTLIKTLLQKLKKASRQTGIKCIAIAGGVAANKGLRTELQIWAEKENWDTFIPNFEYCTDNAAMIAMAAHYKFLAADFCTQSVSPLSKFAL